MPDHYDNREQTRAKHFVLQKYLQALAFKVLHFSDMAYVDGFSGPWKTETENFSDSSFMIAISALRDAQQKNYQQTGRRRKIKCFFSEIDPVAFQKLNEAVSPHHDPLNLFEIKTYHGKFEDAVSEIQSFIGSAFPLIFIDPTGWTGYPFEKIKPLFAKKKCEVLINFMYAFVSRFAHSDDPTIIASLDPILGGPGWTNRLDQILSRGPAVEKLFRETLKEAGAFDFVVSTKIDKATSERPHFFLAYGTKSREGLKAFREIEYAALRAHAANRAGAKGRRRDQEMGSIDMFAEHNEKVQESSINEIVNEQKALAKVALEKMLGNELEIRFSDVVDFLLQEFMLRETNVKDIVVDLAACGKVKNTWGSGNRKPQGDISIIAKR